MIRSYILTAAFVGCTLGVMAQVSVTSKVPTSVVPGGEFKVELKISKGDIGGFAKLQHELPTGFTAIADETANSTFSFKDRKVKFLWMALPGTPDILVTYKVKVDAGVSGNQILEGNFSYIRNNETEKFILPKDIIIVSADQAASAQDAANQRIIEDQRKKAEAAEAARAAAAAEESASTASATETETAPAKQESQPVADNSAAQKAAADKAAADKAASDRAASDKAAADKAAKDAAKEAERQAKQQQQAAAKPAASQTSGSDAMLKTVPGLVFRVQIAAGANNVDPSWFANKYNITDPISVEQHEGLYKYVVGEFGSYRPAKTFCNDLRDSNNVDGPFVTAYNNGVRIHVKEALDIAGQ